jgi:HNH endonuclease
VREIAVQLDWHCPFCLVPMCAVWDGELRGYSERIPGHPQADRLLTVEHLVPLSRGGTNAPENLAPACAACNGAKGDRLPSEWRHPRRWWQPTDPPCDGCVTRCLTGT